MEDFDVARVVAESRRLGINVDWTGRCTIGREDAKGLLSGYGAIDAAAIPKALRLLRGVFAAG